MTSANSNLLLYIVPDTEVPHSMKVWVRKSFPPIVLGYTDDPSVKETVADFFYQLPMKDAAANEKYKIFQPSYSLKGAGRYYFSILMNSIEGNKSKLYESRCYTPGVF